MTGSTRGVGRGRTACHLVLLRHRDSLPHIYGLLTVPDLRDEQRRRVEYTDGTYVWPEGLAHYILDHAVRLPDQLVRHAQERLDGLESREVSPVWWVAATARG